MEFAKAKFEEDIAEGLMMEARQVRQFKQRVEEHGYLGQLPAGAHEEKGRLACELAI